METGKIRKSGFFCKKDILWKAHGQPWALKGCPKSRFCWKSTTAILVSLRVDVWPGGSGWETCFEPRGTRFRSQTSHFLFRNLLKATVCPKWTVWYICKLWSKNVNSDELRRCYDTRFSVIFIISTFPHWLASVICKHRRSSSEFAVLFLKRRGAAKCVFWYDHDLLQQTAKLKMTRL